MFREKVRQAIVRHEMIQPGDRVVVGLSGGVDSVCLFHVLASLRKELDFSLEVAHLNHMLRGADAEADMRFVEALCQREEIVCHTRSVSIGAMAKEQGVSVETCGREERYRFFHSLHADKIAVAHHADDQAETMLMHLLRGCGLDGLAGMRPVNGNVIRPLLFVSRSEILEYAKDAHLMWREDATNQDTQYRRNQIRHEILPKMEKMLPGATLHMAGVAEKLREDNDALTQWAESEYNALVHREDETLWAEREALLILPVAVRRRVLQKMLEGYGFIGEAHLLPVEELLQKESGTGVDLPGERRAEMEYGRLVIRNRCEAAAEFSMPIRLDAEYTLPTGDTFGVFCASGGILEMDGESVKGDLRIRSRQAGDRWQPIGLQGTKKVKDFLIDQKIPRDVRKHVVILEDDAGIIAVSPYKIANRVKKTIQTKKILTIRHAGIEFPKTKEEQ